MTRAVFLSALFAAAGCDADPTVTRELLRARQSEWTGRVDTLKAQHADLAARLARVPAPQTADMRQRGAHVQVQAAVAGLREALGYLDAQLLGIPGAVEGSLRQGGGKAGAEALETATTRVGDSLRTMTERIGVVERDIARLERS